MQLSISMLAAIGFLIPAKLSIALDAQIFSVNLAIFMRTNYFTFLAFKSGLCRLRTRD